MSKRRVDHVDPFIGVDGENNCLCGPYLPNSIVRLGPDTLPPHLSHGYDSSRPIIRFSHTHVSGTGGGGRYGNVGFTPIPECRGFSWTLMRRGMNMPKPDITA